MIKFKHHGSFSKTEKTLSARRNYSEILRRFAQEGIIALRSATPKDSGLSSESWRYEFEHTRKGVKVYWTNENLVDGIPVVILLQYGHGTRGGTFVQGRDFINPAMKPIFDSISENLWKEVTR